MDPSTILMTMGMATQRLGLGVTYSTTYYEPFHVARVFATMDLMLKGRAAWNVVTSLNSAEAGNFGRGEHMGHDARYDRADEFMEVVLGHWNTWEDDALILDKATGRFADPAKVHRLDHVGPVFPLARTVQRAALAAGPSGADPGRAVRPGPGLRREMGGAGVRDLSLAGGRQAGVRRLQGRRRGRRARPGQGACRAGLLCLRRRKRGSGGGKTRGDRGDRPRGGRSGAALGSAELRFCEEADR